MAALFCVIAMVGQATAEIKLGVLAFRGTETAIKEQGALVEYLSERVGEKVTLVPLKFKEFMEFFDANSTGFVFTNPWFYVKAKVMKKAQPIATVSYQTTGRVFGGVIFTRLESPVQSLQDMKGRTIMCPTLQSPGGWLFQKGEMVRQGISPELDFKHIYETDKESHDEVILAVRDGKVDVGTVRTSVFEAMQREGKLKISDFRILNPMTHPNFPDVCSTPLYPDWPVAALAGNPPDMNRKMKEALLSIPKGHPALENARRIDQFVDALDYGPMEDLLKLLKLEPFRRMK
jgi:ABC-type phosphate/phosphonate transport system substrate-binding protein